MGEEVLNLGACCPHLSQNKTLSLGQAAKYPTKLQTPPWQQSEAPAKTTETWGQADQRRDPDPGGHRQQGQQAAGARPAPAAPETQTHRSAHNTGCRQQAHRESALLRQTQTGARTQRQRLQVRRQEPGQPRPARPVYPVPAEVGPGPRGLRRGRRWGGRRRLRPNRRPARRHRPRGAPGPAPRALAHPDGRRRHRAGPRRGRGRRAAAAAAAGAAGRAEGPASPSFSATAGAAWHRAARGSARAPDSASGAGRRRSRTEGGGGGADAAAKDPGCRRGGQRRARRVRLRAPPAGAGRRLQAAPAPSPSRSEPPTQPRLRGASSSAAGTAGTSSVLHRSAWELAEGGLPRDALAPSPLPG